jgi:hypothetical protein
LTPHAYTHLVSSVFVGGVAAVLSVETLLEARLTSEEELTRRALRRWASVGVALCCFVALFLEFEKGEGVLWLTGPVLFGPLLVAWFYLVRLVARAVAFRRLPLAAFSLGSGALLFTSTYFDTPPVTLVLPSFLAAATLCSVVTAVRAFAARRKLGG